MTTNLTIIIIAALISITILAFKLIDVHTKKEIEKAEKRYEYFHGKCVTVFKLLVDEKDPDKINELIKQLRDLIY